MIWLNVSRCCFTPGRASTASSRGERRGGAGGGRVDGTWPGRPCRCTTSTCTTSSATAASGRFAFCTARQVVRFDPHRALQQVAGVVDEADDRDRRSRPGRPGCVSPSATPGVLAAASRRTPCRRRAASGTPLGGDLVAGHGDVGEVGLAGHLGAEQHEPDAADLARRRGGLDLARTSAVMRLRRNESRALSREHDRRRPAGPGWRRWSRGTARRAGRRGTAAAWRGTPARPWRRRSGSGCGAARAAAASSDLHPRAGGGRDRVDAQHPADGDERREQRQHRAPPATVTSDRHAPRRARPRFFTPCERPAYSAEGDDRRRRA